ncbi:class I SAM-dependent methyltransferase [Geomonas sp. RF6]|uniref:class I SAM-dependent methyltransferase n=1 Tax=Geomonas sp. RF6 TaxID=2897342 RepID=UPI001E542805|nr:class I SAM-dependent methyltransferase [Geomonas sp. RF6]UFS72437.1 class I SAM-dependent methyltransferase [Geomonas sp. RF6]
MKDLVEKHWDYSLHAKYYEYRPNYNPRAIDLLAQYVGSTGSADFVVADLGAGTGNLTIMLLERGVSVVAVEPNDQMRGFGIERTAESSQVKWVKANGTETGIADATANWVTFGSSFNVMDRTLALKEAHRILKPGGYFSCMWNHRNLHDPIQEQAENIIVSFVPDYDRGVRREDQRPVLEEHEHLFGEILYLESDFVVPRTIDQYISAWRSVKNKYWDFATEEGAALFGKITEAMRKELPAEFTIRYTTRAWTAQRVG